MSTWQESVYLGNRFSRGSVTGRQNNRSSDRSRNALDRPSGRRNHSSTQKRPRPMGARISAFFEAACRPTVNYTFGRYYCYQFLVNPHPRRPISRTRSDQSRTSRRCMRCVNFISFFFPYASRFFETRILFSSRHIIILRFVLYLLPDTLKYRRESLSSSFSFEDRHKKIGGEHVKIRRRLQNTYNSILLNNSFINYFFDYLVLQFYQLK